MTSSKKGWLLFAVTCAALFLCYSKVIAGMIDQWTNDEDMGHGFLVPFVIGFVVWRERKRWMQLEFEPSPWGIVLMLAAVGMHLISAIGAGLFAGSVAMLVSIAGAVLCLGGWKLLRTWSFPIVLMLFMLPKLAVLYNQATLPMQLFASQMAAGMLTMTGVGVIRNGNVLDVGGHQVAVAEACSGIRYLMPLGFMGVVFGYLADTRAWMRLVLLVWAVPVAIVANAVRVAFSAYSPKLADGTWHALLGLAIFLLCLATFIPVRTVWNRLLGDVSHA
ncbi:MAG: exosortase/archaeosortase family protein [Bryobacteraceae bacterium]